MKSPMSWFNQPDNALNVTQIAIYGSVSFLVVSLLGVLIYITCSKRYRLNWFEKNLLESAKEREAALRHSQDGQISCPIAYNVDAVAGTSRYLNRTSGSPLAKADTPPFWASQGLYRKSDSRGQLIDTSDEETTGEESGDSACSSGRSVIAAPSGAVAIASTGKHVVLVSASPAKPTTSTSLAAGPSGSNGKAAKGVQGDQSSRIDMVDSVSTCSTVSRDELVGEDARGAIHLTLGYDPAAGILNVKLVEAQDLQPQDFSGTADPYAKIRLLPDRNNMWQTRIHKKTLNPVFDEDFVFEVRSATIGRRTLEILLFDFDAYSRHVCIGGVQFPLAQVCLAEKIDIWRPLLPYTEQDNKQDLGDLMVSLSYVPSAEKLTVVIIKARNLRVIDATRNSSDPYVKVCLYNADGRRIKKRKTTVARNTTAPVYNEALSFDISRETLKDCSIEFQVLHDSLLGRNETLGRATVGNGPEFRPENRKFFDELFRTRAATAQWISLSELKQKSTAPSKK
ncbi:synaptotagmin-5 [Anopheles ziemanni]|uniref:synaptotagmin-5 n=1 Tax=Anopheles coustani TaxID=139045 RepID=UPI00265A64AD|nr:synaptotagmin-5 [Anopheles coustani]XP_058178877.1 synaptotagmin-5 [Anopheles ziemanni]